MKRLKKILPATLAIAAALLFAACTAEIPNEQSSQTQDLAESKFSSTGSGSAKAESSATESAGGTAGDTAESLAEGETASEAAAPDNAESAGEVTEAAPEPETEDTPEVKTEPEVKAEEPSAVKLIGISEEEREDAAETNVPCSHTGLMLKNNTDNNKVNVCLGCILSGNWKKAGFKKLDIDLKGEVYDLTGIEPTSADKLPDEVKITNGYLVVDKNKQYKWEALAAKLKLDSSSANFIDRNECVHDGKLRVKNGCKCDDGTCAGCCGSEKCTSESCKTSCDCGGTCQNHLYVCLGCILSGDWKKAGFTSLYIDLKGETLDLTGVPPTDPDKLPGPKESTVTAGTAKSGVTLKNGILLVGKSDKWDKLLEAINLDNVLWIKETR